MLSLWMILFDWLIMGDGVSTLKVMDLPCGSSLRAGLSLSQMFFSFLRMIFLTLST